jgi:8-oxo-dGTP pyrophosphatase MutT (NUDIX family)
MTRPTHRISVKIALMNTLGNKVLVTQLHDGRYGLPGGHLEYDETPLEALSRELHEELGITFKGKPIV